MHLYIFIKVHVRLRLQKKKEIVNCMHIKRSCWRLHLRMILLCNLETSKLYMTYGGSAKQLSVRPFEHLKKVPPRSNIHLQNSIKKYGLEKFVFVPVIFKNIACKKKYLDHKNWICTNRRKNGKFLFICNPFWPIA